MCEGLGTVSCDVRDGGGGGGGGGLGHPPTGRGVVAIFGVQDTKPLLNGPLSEMCPLFGRKGGGGGGHHPGVVGLELRAHLVWINVELSEAPPPDVALAVGWQVDQVPSKKA